MNKSVLMVMFGRNVGGAEMQFIELANFLAQTYSVTLVSLGGGGSIQAARLDPRINIKIYEHEMKRLFFIIPRRFSIYPSLFKVLMLALQGKYNTVISTSYWGDVLGYLISKLMKVKTLSLQTVSKCMRNPRVDRFVLKRLDYLVAGAQDIQEYLVLHGQGNDRIHVINNWVDFSARETSLNSKQVKSQYAFNDKIVIGCIGRLHPQKGQIFLIRAFAQIKQKLPEHVLILVGSGDDYAVLLKEVESLDLVESVFFLGNLSGEDYNNIFNAIDIYVQPSVFEGLPRTLLDAMYMEKPIIASDANGNREAIQHGKNGCLVAPKDIDELGQAMLLLANNRSLQLSLSKQAKLDVLQCYDMQMQLKKIESLIES